MFSEGAAPPAALSEGAVRSHVRKPLVTVCVHSSAHPAHCPLGNLEPPGACSKLAALSLPSVSHAALGEFTVPYFALLHWPPCN